MMMLINHINFFHINSIKGKVFYGQEPPSGESTTTECGVNYQLLAVITEVAQWGTPSCSRPQPATNNNWIVRRMQELACFLDPIWSASTFLVQKQQMHVSAP